MRLTELAGHRSSAQLSRVMYSVVWACQGLRAASASHSLRVNRVTVPYRVRCRARI